MQSRVEVRRLENMILEWSRNLRYEKLQKSGKIPGEEEIKLNMIIIKSNVGEGGCYNVRNMILKWFWNLRYEKSREI